jgi:hypothetical protein
MDVVNSQSAVTHGCRKELTQLLEFSFKSVRCAYIAPKSHTGVSGEFTLMNDILHKFVL